MEIKTLNTCCAVRRTIFTFEMSWISSMNCSPVKYKCPKIVLKYRSWVKVPSTADESCRSQAAFLTAVVDSLRVLWPLQTISSGNLEAQARLCQNSYFSFVTRVAHFPRWGPHKHTHTYTTLIYNLGSCPSSQRLGAPTAPWGVTRPRLSGLDVLLGVF